MDVSEEGMAFRLDSKAKVRKGDICRASVVTEYYQAELAARIVHVKEEGDGQFLAAVVEPENEKSRRHWLQIVHDREHSLPKEIDPWMTVYDDISRNIRLRFLGQKRSG